DTTLRRRGIPSRLLMFDYFVYLLYRVEAAALTALPLRMVYAVGNAAGFFGWLLFGRYRRLARRNVTIAFGQEKSPRQLRRLVRQHFQRLCANLLCSIKLANMPVDEILRHVKVENIEAMDRQLRAGVPVVLVLSHLGTWELFAHIPPKFIGHVRNASVYQRLGNRYIDAHFRQIRSRNGLELFDRKEGFQPVVQLLRSGGAVGILSDQHAGDHGLWTPLFGRLASTSSLSALLAKRTNAAMIAGAVYTTGPAQWRMVFSDRFDRPGAPIEELTASVNRIIERQIRQSPADWLWAHNRWKTPKPNFLLAKYKRGVYLPPNLSATNLQSFRILVRSSNWLGDAIMSIPAVRAIKAGRPDAHITVVAPARLAAVWKLVPDIDVVLPLASKSVFRAARLIRQQAPFDVSILLPNSLRSTIEVWLARVPRRFGYRGHRRSWLLNQRIRHEIHVGPLEHHSRRYLRLAEIAGADIQGKTLNSESVRERCAQRSTLNAQRLKLALCPGAEYGPAKRWLPERFAEVATNVATQKKVQWILLGTEKDIDLGKQIADAIGDCCVNRIGQTSIEQLIDELRECRLLLTNDTGTMHLAALLGVPTVSIFGSTEPLLTGPLGDGHVVLRHHVECSPCFLRECPIDFRCMKVVTASEVTDAVMSILARGP
ncbi:MAG: lipopolysaccharide heptosyltransferase II, partial [Chthoniobacterales bacterium]